MIFRIFGGAEFQVPASSFRGKHDFLFPPPKLGEIGGDPWMLMDKVWKLFCFITSHFAPRLEYLHHFWSNEYVPWLFVPAF